MGVRVLIETKFDLEHSARMKVRRVSRHRWHAVTIAAPANACAAAQACKGKRFLSGDAPGLPLVECDAAKRCECKYRHYDDRRGDSRRQGNKGAEQQGREQSNRRGRRASD
jgi:hypothetical protein